MASESSTYVSRGGEKLAAALDHFAINIQRKTCCDLGSHVGGFVDCLLRRGAERVYSIDTAYGTLAWKLRQDPRVVVMERTNAMHVALPEPIDVVTIDLGWTKQTRVLPNVEKLIAHPACVVTLIKPHYEALRELLVDGVLPDHAVDEVVAGVLEQIGTTGWVVRATMVSPIRGHGGNRELFALLCRGC